MKSPLNLGPTHAMFSPFPTDRAEPLFSAGQKNCALFLKTLFFLCVVEALPAFAQSVIMTTPHEPALAPYLRNQNPPPPPSQPPGPPLSPYTFGSIAFHPRLSYQYLNSEGVPIKGGTRANTEVHTISAGVSADLSDHWSFDYSPSWVYYTGKALTDSFEQSASLSGVYVLQDWTFQLAQNYSATNQTLVETAQQTKQDSWGTTLSSFYNFSPKLQFHSSVGLTTRQTSVGTDIRSWSVQTGINYRISPRLSLSLSPGFSYTEIADGSDTYGESYTAQMNWHPVDKLTIGIGSGIRYTHSTSSTGRDLSKPQMSLSLGYHPFETTSLSFNLSRSTSPSYFKDQETQNRRWNLNLNQRLLGRFYLNASYSRQDNSYIVLTANVPSPRDDLVESYSLRLSTQLSSRLSTSASFQESKNTSSATGFSFSSTQYGFQLSYEY